MTSIQPHLYGATRFVGGGGGIVASYGASTPGAFIRAIAVCRPSLMAFSSCSQSSSPCSIPYTRQQKQPDPHGGRHVRLRENSVAPYRTRPSPQMSKHVGHGLQCVHAGLQHDALPTSLMMSRS
mmetsp:Transcript_22044/g.51809  ORF Transcript_22044/g.51809 Transcript_22044/m.51809 type:complete len:124 (+) Transcript_22044:11-382(+)